MSGRLAGLLLALALGGPLGCSEPSAPVEQAPKQARLGGGVIATVGGQQVQALSVAAIASQRQIPLEQARDAAIYDALLAAGASSALPPRELSAARRQVLARAVLRQLLAATQATPISDEELDAATAERWLQVARPRGYRSVHAVVKLAEDAGEEERRSAQALAEKVRAAVRSVAQRMPELPPSDYPEEDTFDSIRVAERDPASKQFMERAKTAAAGDPRVLPQVLQVVAADGRVLDKNVPPPGLQYDTAFAEAISQLPARGALSEVVRSAFGYHVILLLEITPERQLDRPARLAELRDGILRGRGVRLQRQLLASVAKQRRVEIKTNVDALLELVSAR